VGVEQRGAYVSPYLRDAWPAETYDARVAQVWNDRDLGLYLDLAAASGGPLLELAVGTGRVALPLARAGHEIVGLDQSPHMLAVARRKLAQEPPEVQARVTLLEGDMSDFALARRFALILIPFRTFQALLTRAAQRGCLESCARHLAPGGRLVLDVFNPRLSRISQPGGADDPTHEYPQPDGSVIRQHGHAEFDLGEQMLHDWMWCERVTPDGAERVREEELRLRYLFRFELEWMLEACGFEIEALYGDFDKSPFGSDSPEMIPVARKRKSP